MFSKFEFTKVHSHPAAQLLLFTGQNGDDGVVGCVQLEADVALFIYSQRREATADELAVRAWRKPRHHLGDIRHGHRHREESHTASRERHQAARCVPVVDISAGHGGPEPHEGGDGGPAMLAHPPTLACTVIIDDNILCRKKTCGEKWHTKS